MDTRQYKTAKQVAKWLEENGAGRFAQYFIENDIASDVLPDLTMDDLRALGVEQLGERIRLKKLLALYCAPPIKVDIEARVDAPVVKSEPLEEHPQDVEVDASATAFTSELLPARSEIVAAAGTGHLVNSEIALSLPRDMALDVMLGVNTNGASHGHNARQPSVPSGSSELYKIRSPLVHISGRIEPIHVGNALELIEAPVIQSRRRVVAEGVVYRGFTLGLVKNYSRGPCLSRHMQAGYELPKLLLDFLKQRKPYTCCSSIQLNFNTVAKLHCDTYNTDRVPSYIMKVGDFDGGELFVYDPAGDTQIEVREHLRGQWRKDFPVGATMTGFLKDCRNQLVEFNGTQPHMTMPVTRGYSIAVIWYTRQEADRVPWPLRQQLHDFGFRLPPPNAWGGGRTPGEEKLYEGQVYDEDDTDDEEIVIDSDEEPLEKLSDVEIADWLAKLRNELIVTNPRTALNHVQRSDRRQILLLGECQSGKGYEKVLWAFEAAFVDKTVPYVVVKNQRGDESARQFRDRDVADFNKKVITLLRGWGASEVAQHHFVLQVRLPREEFEPESPKAQVMIRLANATSVKNICAEVYKVDAARPRAEGSLPDRPIRITFLWDEADLCTTSQNRDKGRLEKLLFKDERFAGYWAGKRTLWDAVQRNVLVTATICMPAMTSPKPFGLARLPVPTSYCGHATGSVHHPILREVPTGHGNDPEGLRPGLLEMINYMHNESTNALALIHAEKFIKQHRAVQEAIARRCEELVDEAVVIVHNSGQERAIQSSFALSLVPTQSIREELRTFLGDRDTGFADSWISSDLASSGVRFSFRRNVTIRDLLTLVRKFRDSGRRRLTTTPFYVYVVTGQSGGRGVTFRDDTGQLFVKHMFFHLDVQSACGEYLLQAANRISANHSASVPDVFFWTSKTISQAIVANHNLVQEVWNKLEENLDTSPKDLFDHTELEAAKELLGAGLPVKPTRGGVHQNGFVAPGGLDIDGGKASKPQCMLGGILVTRDVLEQAALREHQLVAQVDLENLKLDTIAKRYYDDFTDTARIFVMDTVHVFPKDKLPAEVQAELPETEPLSSKPSMDFKRALQAYLWNVPAENPRSAPRFHRAGRFPLWISLGTEESASFSREGWGNDYYEVVWTWDHQAQTMTVIRRKNTACEIAKLKTQEMAKDPEARTVFVWHAFRQNGSEPPRLDIFLSRLALHQIDPAQTIIKHNVRCKAVALASKSQRGRKRLRAALTNKTSKRAKTEVSEELLPGALVRFRADSSASTYGQILGAKTTTSTSSSSTTGPAPKMPHILVRILNASGVVRNLAPDELTPVSKGDLEGAALCMYCGKSEPESQLLLCDRFCDFCLHCAHIGCLDPPLAGVPSGDWLCAACSNEDGHGAAKCSNMVAKDDKQRYSVPAEHARANLPAIRAWGPWDTYKQKYAGKKRAWICKVAGCADQDTKWSWYAADDPSRYSHKYQHKTFCLACVRGA